MITRVCVVLVALTSTLFAAGCGGGTECGPGTVDQDGECVPSNPITCGAGTVEQDGECVVPEEVAPVVTAIDPVDDFVGGGADFTITGTGLTGATAVMFGGASASFTVDSDTQITGTVPLAAAKNVTVTVTTAGGSDGADFAYVGIYAADGGSGFPGNLYLLDPRDGTHLVVGSIASSADTGHGVTGMEFDASGTLYAVEATYAESRSSASNLLTIDPDSGAATVIGALNDCCIPDVTFSGATLLGWSRTNGDAVSIDTSTGAATSLGGDTTANFGDGIVTLADGTVLFAPDGLGGVSGGDVLPLNPADGTLGSIVFTMDGAARDAVAALTRYRGTVYGVVHGGATASLFSVDTTSGAVTMLGRVPAMIDALASDDPDAPASASRVPRPRALSATEQADLAGPACSGQPGVASVTIFGATRTSLAADAIAGRADSIAIAGKLAGRRGVAAASVLGSVQGVTTVEVIPCAGEPLRVPAADLGGLVLTPNQRGQIKLLDAQGRTLLRNVVELRAF